LCFLVRSTGGQGVFGSKDGGERGAQRGQNHKPAQGHTVLVQSGLGYPCHSVSEAGASAQQPTSHQAGGEQPFPIAMLHPLCAMFVSLCLAMCPHTSSPDLMCVGIVVLSVGEPLGFVLRPLTVSIYDCRKSHAEVLLYRHCSRRGPRALPPHPWQCWSSAQRHGTTRITGRVRLLWIQSRRRTRMPWV